MHSEIKPTMKILFVSSEVAPFSKSGGLGDVAAALPKELYRQGADIRVVCPKYANIPERLISGAKYVAGFETNLSWRRQSVSVYEINTPVTTYLIGNDFYFGRDGYYGYGDDFERFALFSKAALEMAAEIDFKPDVIHLNDWQMGLAAVYLKDRYKKFTFFQNTKSLFTMHNLQFQGIFGRDTLPSMDLDDGYFTGGGIEFYGNVSLLKAGIAYSDALSTVSETYAKEIQTPMYSYGMDGVIRGRGTALHGIVNGIDYDANNPRTDEQIFYNYSPEDALQGKEMNKLCLQEELGLPKRADVPMLAMVSRLADQKGLDILAIVMDELLNRDINLVILGQGDGRYEELLNYHKWKYPGKCCFSPGFNTTLAQKIYAASDFFLMPSLFEPCGLSQLMAMRYGSLPIVRRTGGLADTVLHFGKETPGGNGFVFEDYLASGLMWAINEALACYYDKEMLKRAIGNAMSCDFSWASSAGKYLELYESLRETP